MLRREETGGGRVGGRCGRSRREEGERKGGVGGREEGGREEGGREGQELGREERNGHRKRIIRKRESKTIRI